MRFSEMLFKRRKVERRMHRMCVVLCFVALSFVRWVPAEPYAWSLIDICVKSWNGLVQHFGTDFFWRGLVASLGAIFLLASVYIVISAIIGWLLAAFVSLLIRH